MCIVNLISTENVTRPLFKISIQLLVIIDRQLFLQEFR